MKALRFIAFVSLARKQMALMFLSYFLLPLHATEKMSSWCVTHFTRRGSKTLAVHSLTSLCSIPSPLFEFPLWEAIFQPRDYWAILPRSGTHKLSRALRHQCSFRCACNGAIALCALLRFAKTSGSGLGRV